VPASGLLATIIFVIVVAFPLHAQSPAPPDISGAWLLRTSNPVPRSASARLSQTIVIARFEDSIEMRITTKGRDSIAHYVADGKSRVVRGGFWDEENVTTVAARWEETSLVVTRTRHNPWR
jgi:hypothetical protein